MTQEQLKQIVDDQKTDLQMKTVGEYLLRKCNESEDYAAKVQQEGYTLRRCMTYIFYRAAKLNTKHEAMLMIGQDEVFSWADDYFSLDQTQEQEKVKEAEKLMAELRLSRRNAGTGERKEKQEKKDQTNAEKTSGRQKEKVPEKDSDKTAEIPVPVEKKKAAPEPAADREKKKTGSKSLEGQFSLFDMMEEGF